MENFIRIWENVVPDNLCDRIVSFFESVVDDETYRNQIQNGKSQFGNNLGRSDLSFYLEEPTFNKADLVEELQKYLKIYLDLYVKEFGQISSLNFSNYNNLKIQRTLPLGGYHYWHYENASGQYTHARELVWMVYLNTMPPNEAETEFLYQKMRIRPSKGTVVFFPAGMTHVHRGLTVYSEPKYIATGWYYKMQDF